MDHERYMREALALAQSAAEQGEVPVGCVVVNDMGHIIGRGQNRREKSRCATAHAEMEAIKEACKSVGDWRLSNCSLYVTLEPCPMCAGAIINARIKRVYYGAKDVNTGSCGSVINLFFEPYGHEPQITGGILEAECVEILQMFFQAHRKKKRESK